MKEIENISKKASQQSPSENKLQFSLMDLDNYKNIKNFAADTEEEAIKIAYLFMEQENIFATSLETYSEEGDFIGTTNLVLKIKYIGE